MEKFISAEEYKELLNKKGEVSKETTKKVTFSERIDLTIMTLFGDEESALDYFKSVAKRVNKLEEVKELRKYIKDALIEQDVPIDDFKKVLEALKTSDKKTLDFMKAIVEIDSFGDPSFDSMAKSFLLIDGLLKETDASVKDIKMYVKNEELLSVSMISEESFGKKHEYTINFEDDKIYQKTQSFLGTSTSEEYISDKMKELGIEHEELSL